VAQEKGKIEFKILVVDDELVVLQLTKTMLEREGYEVLVVQGAKRSVGALREILRTRLGWFLPAPPRCLVLHTTTRAFDGIRRAIGFGH
jgi:CheY-like chemotaxis protein